MILRRLADAVREQNWVTVALEVTIVVVGIFIGLQVDDWNRQRLDRADEKIFLNRLHEELESAISVRAFIRNRRIENWENLRSGLEAAFGFNDRKALTDAECRAIYNSHIKTANITELPSFRTLVETGRLDIINDEELRATLVQFSQRQELIRRFADSGGVELGPKYADLFGIEPFINTVDERNDLDVRVKCNLRDIRHNTVFLREFFANADRYDAYMVSGLMPMVKTGERLHELLDQNLGVTHDP